MTSVSNDTHPDSPRKSVISIVHRSMRVSTPKRLARVFGRFKNSFQNRNILTMKDTFLLRRRIGAAISIADTFDLSKK